MFLGFFVSKWNSDEYIQNLNFITDCDLKKFTDSPAYGKWLETAGNLYLFGSRAACFSPTKHNY
jgi:hypothetical protein